MTRNYNKEYLTINTDASFCPDTGAAGYAFWITSSHFRFKHSGVFKNRVDNPNSAELFCIGNAISFVLKNVRSMNLDGIVINTDSKNCIDKINECHDGYYVKEVLKLIDNMKVLFSCNNFRMKHVLAHTGRKNSRSYVNNWCDMQAKHKMRQMRKSITKQQLDELDT